MSGEEVGITLYDLNSLPKPQEGAAPSEWRQYQVESELPHFLFKFTIKPGDYPTVGNHVGAIKRACGGDNYISETALSYLMGKKDDPAKPLDADTYWHLMLHKFDIEGVKKFGKVIESNQGDYPALVLPLKINNITQRQSYQHRRITTSDNEWEYNGDEIQVAMVFDPSEYAVKVVRGETRYLANFADAHEEDLELIASFSVHNADNTLQSMTSLVNEVHAIVNQNLYLDESISLTAIKKSLYTMLALPQVVNNSEVVNVFELHNRDEIVKLTNQYGSIAVPILQLLSGPDIGDIEIEGELKFWEQLISIYGVGITIGVGNTRDQIVEEVHELKKMNEHYLAQLRIVLEASNTIRSDFMMDVVRDAVDTVAVTEENAALLTEVRRNLLEAKAIQSETRLKQALIEAQKENARGYGMLVGVRITSDETYRIMKREFIFGVLKQIGLPDALAVSIREKLQVAFEEGSDLDFEGWEITELIDTIPQLAPAFNSDKQDSTETVFQKK